MSEVPSPDHLGRHVLDGPAEGKGTLFNFVREELATKAEVGEGDVAVAVQENVFQLDVPVDDAVLEMKKKILLP